MKLLFGLLLGLFIPLISEAQTGFSSDPLQAEFITRDVDHFWAAFDSLGKTKGNPFVRYVQQGSPGLKGFIPNRIVSAEELYAKVLERKADYLKARHVLKDLAQKEKAVKAVYSAMKYWYPAAKFPPVYFVVGRLNSGGTVSENGIILGVEMMKNLDGLVPLIAHELIHFQQKFLDQQTTLLAACIMEGSADFIGELISGVNSNPTPFAYGEAHSDALSKEFVQVMNSEQYQDWLYGTSGKDQRPNDVGYWMGYKIAAAYFQQATDKHAAIREMLDLNNASKVMRESGYLNQ